MSVILSTLRELARTLGCGDHQAETVVREDRSARLALSRRGLFNAAGAVAAGLVVSVPSATCAQLVEGDWLWVGGQSIAAENGIYVVTAGLWRQTILLKISRL